MACVVDAARPAEPRKENVVGEDVLGGYFMEESGGGADEAKVRVEVQEAVSDDSAAAEAELEELGVDGLCSEWEGIGGEEVINERRESRQSELALVEGFVGFAHLGLERRDWLWEWT